ncbi:hypothetical protein BJ138DRAFT_300820 [Hygrophoropsis aurantiaca]|uniref:Uncharacterized protein n=1 Tax=Hygrophoropsis aurantiaca TaxID=72124 RepID=A0ACB8A5Y0_9AGAM|nr:hypothetical protein BJ138DRAFT_300820 [Hygrophoropsis aurantiaca]
MLSHVITNTELASFQFVIDSDPARHLDFPESESHRFFAGFIFKYHHSPRSNQTLDLVSPLAPMASREASTSISVAKLKSHSGIFAGLACFSRHVPRNILVLWEFHGGIVADHPERASAKYFFAAHVSEDWVTKLLSRSVVVLHANWIDHCVARGFCLPIGKYILDGMNICVFPDHFCQKSPYHYLERAAVHRSPKIPARQRSPMALEPIETNSQLFSMPATSTPPKQYLKRKREFHDNKQHSSATYDEIPRRPKKRRNLRFDPSFSPIRASKSSKLRHENNFPSIPANTHITGQDHVAPVCSLGHAFSDSRSPKHSCTNIVSAPCEETIPQLASFLHKALPLERSFVPIEIAARQAIPNQDNIFGVAHTSQNSERHSIPFDGSNNINLRFPAPLPVQVRFLHRFIPQPPLSPKGIDSYVPDATRLEPNGGHSVTAQLFSGPKGPRTDPSYVDSEIPEDIMARGANKLVLNSSTHPFGEASRPLRVISPKQRTPILNLADLLEKAKAKKSSEDHAVRFQANHGKLFDDTSPKHSRTSRTIPFIISNDSNDTAHFMIQDILHVGRQFSKKSDSNDQGTTNTSISTSSATLFAPGSRYRGQRFRYIKNTREQLIDG